MEYLQIKKEFRAWILGSGNPERLVDRAFSLVEDAAYEFFADDADVKSALSRNFSPARIDRAVQFARLIQEDFENTRKRDEAIATAHYESARANSWMDDDAVSEVDSIAVIYSDRIEVTANVTGMGEKLPKAGRKYVGGKGDIRWSFPLAILPDIRRCVDLVLMENGDRG